MPARYVKSYKYVAPDGEEFETLAAAQTHELASLMPADGFSREDANIVEHNSTVAAWVVAHRQEIIPILKQGERKRQSPAKPKRGRKAATTTQQTVEA